MNYQSFDNSALSMDATSVRFFLQDKQGLIWAGTNKGLYSYDGYESLPHFTPGGLENRMVNCGMFFKEDCLLIGSEKGILLYNLKYGKYVPFELEFSKDIRAMVLHENDLWLGCTDGLFRYNFQEKKLFEMLLGQPINKKARMINSLLEDNGFIYVGANEHFGRFSLNSYKYIKIEGSNGRDRLVNSMIKDKGRNCIWIGEGHTLTKYIPALNSFENTSGFPVVKAIELDCDNNLVLGTDNGLFIYDGKTSHHFEHNALKPNSLSNNIIWCIFRDTSDNIWMGTDFGISLAPRQRKFDFIPIFQFSGKEQGNQIYKIFRDSKGFYWLGGDNGLIRTRQLNTVDPKLRWYTMGSSKFYLPHNHIRNIYEDKDLNLWVNTDYGVCQYNYKTEKFSVHFIISKDTMYNANWAYDILEDSAGNLWISSFGGGLFKISKNHLVDKQLSVADSHYTIKNGLSSNNIDRIVFDKTGKVWVLTHNNGVDVLNPATGLARKYPILSYTKGKFPNSMISDTDGNIWLGLRNEVVCIDPGNEKINSFDLEEADNAIVLSLLQIENKIWVSTNEGLWIIDKKDYSLQHITLANQMFFCMDYDESSDKIFLGGVDGIAECLPFIYESKNPSHKITISSILVNNKRYINNNNEPAIGWSDKIELPYNQNNIVVSFSDLQYSKESRGTTYVFRINKNEENWTPVSSGDNKIYLNKLTPGIYDLAIGIKESKKEPVTTLKSFKIIIRPPWYYTFLAKGIYLLVLTGLILWGILFFHQKQKLKFARIEKEKTLEQTKMKVDFFSNIAHEFKTPLSLIIAPLSKLIQEKKNEKEKNDLELIHQNAMKLNSLVQQAIEYYRDDSKVPVGLVLSRLEVVEFAKSIFANYEVNMKERQLDFIFNSEFDELYIDVDVLKMESVLNNLLSNACKYTNVGDSIILSLKYKAKDKLLVIKVSDNGPGIPEKDLPYVFQRFFQSPASKERGGTGIGLYLVKNFTELHGGTVNVFSNKAEGTTFTVEIPVIKNDISDSKVLQAMVDGGLKKPLLLLVEDNVPLAGFIHRIFDLHYRCVVAYNGRTGLKICNDLKPDIIISDIMMPVMDGLSMCQKLKENIATSTIPIILLTAKDDKETELRSINLNIDAFIAKPFEPDILFSRVNQLLETQKQLGKKIRIEKLSSPVVDKEDSEDEKFLANITKIIEEEIANPDLNVSFLCEKVNISQKQLYRKIKHLTGLTAVDYIKSIRMKKAAILLSNKNFTVSEVMYRIGFSSHSYFAKCFHSEFGKTPGQFANEDPAI